MPTPDYAVLIAGGGPAGSACAAALLRRRPDLGGRVLILERARHPRSKPCGGGLTGHVPAAMAALGLRLLVPSVASPTAQVVFSGMRRQVALGQPVCVVRREEFDHSLLEQVAALGAEVRQGVGLVDFSTGPQGVTVRTTSGAALTASVLVGADGAGSVVRKRLLGHRDGRGGPRPMRLFRAELPVTDPPDDQMIYDFTPMIDGARGYLWVFPVPGQRVNVGLMHYRSGGRGRSPALSGAQLAALCVRHLRRHGIDVPDGALRGWPAWGYDPLQPLSAPSVCLCGDAAGIDALTGEGIAVALEQGQIAGAEICAAMAGGDLRLLGYSRRVRQALVGRELALDRALSWLLYDHGDRDPGWRRWLSMVLFDDDLLSLYAARVSGTLVLSGEKRRLMGVLWRHLLTHRGRRARLDELVSAAGRP